jgi:hypothetical protein
VDVSKKFLFGDLLAARMPSSGANLLVSVANFSSTRVLALGQLMTRFKKQNLNCENIGPLPYR